MSDPEDGIREALLAHSDHRAVRNVFGAYTGRGSATIRDYVEAMRATGGSIAVVADDGAAEIYARWDGCGGRYEHLTVWPPWTVGGYDHKSGSELAAFLEDRTNVQAVLYDHTPFADEAALAGLSDPLFARYRG